MREKKGMERNMKRSIMSFMLAVIFVCSIGGIQPSVQTKAAAYMDVDATAQSAKSIKLQWKKQKNVTSYVIYRCSANYRDVGEGGLPDKKCKYKKIATVSSKKTSYVDKSVKANKWYSYEIRGYRKKKEVARGKNHVYTVMSEVDWDEWQNRAKTTPNSIQLGWTRTNGIKPDGYEVYRADNHSDFKKIQPKEEKGEMFDKTVKPKQTYYYKVRGYYKNGEKKTYTAFSRVTKHQAVNYEGKYKVKRIKEQNVSPSAITLEITSEEYNADLILDAKGEWGISCVKKDKSESGGTGLIEAYSTDGNHWKKPVGENVWIRGGETVSIRFQVVNEDGKPMDLTSMTSIQLYYADEDDEYDASEYGIYEPLIEFDAIKDTSFKVTMNYELYS